MHRVRFRPFFTSYIFCMDKPARKSYDDYEAFMLRHRVTVWRACCRFAHNDKELARDLVQEVYLALWLRFDQLEAGDNPWQQRVWVWRATRSVLVDLYRKRKPATVPLDTVRDLSDHSAAAEMAELIDDLMSRLDDEERRMLQMRLDGYDATEIGRALGIERNAVYQRMNRIINKLRKEYGR